MHSVNLNYKIVTLYWQYALKQRIKEEINNNPKIIIYHGVTERVPATYDYEYFISIRELIRHLKFFKKNYNIISIKELISALKNREKFSNNTLVITFDDALKNQIEYVFDIFNKFNTPWSISVPAGLVGTNRSIWSYEITFLIFDCIKDKFINLPNLSLNIPLLTYNDKVNAIYLLRKKIKRSSTWSETLNIIQDLIDRVGYDYYYSKLEKDGRFLMSDWNEIEELSNNGIEVLSHGYFHIDQSTNINHNELQTEIFASRSLITKMTGKEPLGFVYPNGGKHNLSKAFIKDAGYEFCLTSDFGHVNSKTCLFDIPRLEAEYPLYIMRRKILST
jgi:peptidoglycan/xylan/chitin deacetylase (PgdA/CDA1 family)